MSDRAPNDYALLERASAHGCGWPRHAAGNEKHGIASAAEVDVDTLAARLQRAVQIADATIVAPPFVGAWACKA